MYKWCSALCINARLMIWTKLICTADKSLLKKKIIPILTIFWASCMKVGMEFHKNRKLLFFIILKLQDTIVLKPSSNWVIVLKMVLVSNRVSRMQSEITKKLQTIFLKQTFTLGTDIVMQGAVWAGIPRFKTELRAGIQLLLHCLQPSDSLGLHSHWEHVQKCKYKLIQGRHVKRDDNKAEEYFARGRQTGGKKTRLGASSELIQSSYFRGKKWGILHHIHCPLFFLCWLGGFYLHIKSLSQHLWKSILFSNFMTNYIRNECLK